MWRWFVAAAWSSGRSPPLASGRCVLPGRGPGFCRWTCTEAQKRTRSGGQNLGSEPAAGPAGHPSGQGGCPAVAGDEGYDYGTSLYIAVPSGNWSAGRYQPSLGETDCFDLVVSKFTDTEVDFTLGALYSQQTKDQLTPGTAYQLVVNGAGFSGTVAYT